MFPCQRSQCHPAVDGVGDSIMHKKTTHHRAAQNDALVWQNLNALVFWMSSGKFGSPANVAHVSVVEVVLVHQSTWVVVGGCMLVCTAYR